ncbi:MAG TPA: TonB-dependent receptor, partial [Vulgatibacter sp.]
SGGEAFDSAAVEAARQFVFEPATSDGTPIPVRIGYRYEFVWRPQLEKKTTADFVGRVRDRATHEPVAGVVVTLGSGASTVTGEDGSFRFEDLEPGSWSVGLEGPGLVPVTTEETFEASHVVEALYEVEVAPEGEGDDELDFEIVVAIPRVKKQVVSTEVLADQGRRVPGTQGDVLKVVENMPGVARSAAGSGDLVVWGAAPQDTRVYVDGLRIPRLYHDGGYRSVVHSDLVRSVELFPGGYGPTYGRGLGGVVLVRLSELDEEGTHGSAELNGIDASLSSRARLTDNLHFAIAARRSHLHSVVRETSSLFTDEDVAGVVPIPRFWDGQARLVLRLGADESVEVGGLASSDRIDHTLSSSDPALTSRRSKGLDFHRIFARYEKKAQDGAVTTVVASVGGDSSSRVDSVGATATELRDDATVYALRASWRGPVAPSVIAEVGVDADFTVSTSSRFGSIGAPPREGDPTVFGQPPPDRINADAWDTVIGSIAPYAQVDFGFFDDRLHLVPGLRAEPYIAQTSRSTPKIGDLPAVSIVRADAVLEPRLSARYAVTPGFGLRAAYGVYHQAPGSEDLSAVFGTPSLGLSTARHWLAGASYRLTEGLEVEVVGFTSRSEELAVRNPAQSPALAEALVQSGEGRSYGGQLLLRQDRIGPFFGWLSYSLSRSERRDAQGQAWRLFDYDQLHVFTAVGSFDLGAGVEIGGRLRASTGFPRTPVVGSYYDAASDRYQPIFGERNSARIPWFLSADVRISKRFAIQKSELELYLDVQNVTNHRNPEEVVYDATFSESDYISGFPILPMAGARWSW